MIQLEPDDVFEARKDAEESLAVRNANRFALRAQREEQEEQKLHEKFAPTHERLYTPDVGSAPPVAHNSNLLRCSDGER